MINRTKREECRRDEQRGLMKNAICQVRIREKRWYQYGEISAAQEKEREKKTELGNSEKGGVHRVHYELLNYQPASSLFWLKNENLICVCVVKGSMLCQGTNQLFLLLSIFNRLKGGEACTADQVEKKSWGMSMLRLHTFIFSRISCTHRYSDTLQIYTPIYYCALQTKVIEKGGNIFNLLRNLLVAAKLITHLQAKIYFTVLF